MVDFLFRIKACLSLVLTLRPYERKFVKLIGVLKGAKYFMERGRQPPTAGLAGGKL